MKLKITKIAFLVFTLVLSISALPARAENNNNNPLRARIEDRREMKDGKKDEKKDQKREDRKDDRKGDKDREGTSTPKHMFKELKEGRKDLPKNMEKKNFEVRRQALLTLLRTSLTNLTSIRARVNDRIVKLETEGKVVTDAKAALVIADAKLAKARVAVDIFANANFGTTTASTTPDMNLEKPRKMADEAIKALKDTRDALKKVVEIIIRMIRNDLNNATTTPL